MLDKTIGFIGAGQMATALAAGFVGRRLTAPEQLVAADPDLAARSRFAQATGARTTDDNRQAADVDVLFLAVKPQQLSSAIDGLRGALAAETLVVSIAAGVKLATLGEALRPAARVIRVMPNTPCLVGQGASAYCLGAHASRDDAQLVGHLLAAVGQVFEVDEKAMDAVTGLSGSGPAFIYLVIEALADGGVQMGLPRAVAAALAAQTVRGAASMVLEGGEHPAVLRDRVASPGGTTIAGLAALEEAAVRGALMAAVAAATRRSIELGSA